MKTGSDNIFADLELPNVDEHMRKARVAMYIAKQIEDLGLTRRGRSRAHGHQPARCLQSSARTVRGLFARTLARVRACARHHENRARRDEEAPPRAARAGEQVADPSTARPRPKFICLWRTRCDRWAKPPCACRASSETQQNQWVSCCILARLWPLSADIRYNREIGAIYCG